MPVSQPVNSVKKPIRLPRLARLLVAALACVALLATASAGAQTKSGKDKKGGKEGGKESGKAEFFSFEYGKDTSSWFWEHQADQEVPPPGVPNPGPLAQRVRAPNPYTTSTIPVAVYQGTHERMAAVRFDLVERGVTPGSEITKALLFIEESPSTEREPPPVRPETAKIEACLLNDLLSPGENEEFKDRPTYSEEECVEGKREVPPGSPALWTFDLTKISEGWGKDPFSNNGFMLLGVLQNTNETWQVNLRLPTKDNTATTENDYEITKNRARLQLAFIPGKEPVVKPIPTAAPPAAPTTGSAPSSGSVGGITPSTDLTGGSGGGFGSGFPPVSTDVTPAPPPLPTTPQAVTQPQPTEPRLPGYVWLLIPGALLALAALRSVVLEPVGGTRTDGVIAAIRRRNAERRGTAPRQASGMMARALSTMRRGAAGTKTTFAKVAGKVGRKR